MSFDVDGYLGDVARSIRQCEVEYGPSWAFFYHVIEKGAIFHEINAALAAIVHNFSEEDSILSHLEMTAFASVRNAHDLTCQLGPGEPSDSNEAFRDTTVQAQLSAFAAEGGIEAPVRTLAQEQWIMEGDGDIIQKSWAHLGKLGLAPSEVPRLGETRPDGVQGIQPPTAEGRWHEAMHDSIRANKSQA